MSSSRGCYSCERVVEFIQVLTGLVFCPRGPEKFISYSREDDRLICIVARGARTEVPFYLLTYFPCLLDLMPPGRGSLDLLVF